MSDEIIHVPWEGLLFVTIFDCVDLLSKKNSINKKILKKYPNVKDEISEFFLYQTKVYS